MPAERAAGDAVALHRYIASLLVAFGNRYHAAVAATRYISMAARILLTGAEGFTGRHLAVAAARRGYEIQELRSNLTDAQSLMNELAETRFDYVVHLAAISAVTHANLQEFYNVNLFGSLNLMDAILASECAPTRVLVASSANVYGNSPMSPIGEQVCPDPLNHYAMSKLAMEQMLKATALPLVFVRPFNYTGVGHDDRFVIPKMVDHFARRAPAIELGNMQVEREFNDVRTVVQAYLDLLELGQAGETYNICSGTTHSLDSVLALLSELTGHSVTARVNPDFMRPNELQRLCGDPAKLEACIGALSHPPLSQTLEWMLQAAEA